MSQPPKPPQIPGVIRRNQICLAEGDPVEPAEGLAVAAGLGKSEAETAFARCLALLTAGDRMAGNALQDLLSRYPDYAPGWEELGQFLLKADKPEAALVCLRRAASVAPTVARLLGCGLALRASGRATEAGAAFAEACRLDPGATRPAFLLGLVAQDRRDFATARHAYERALAIDPALPEAWVNLGIVLQEMGELDAAKRAYGAALRARPDTFGRISQALSTAPRGELWLDLGQLRRSLVG